MPATRVKPPAAVGGGRGLGAAEGVPFGDAKPAQHGASAHLEAPGTLTRDSPPVHQHPSPSQPLGCELQHPISAPHRPDHTGN